MDRRSCPYRLKYTDRPDYANPHHTATASPEPSRIGSVSSNTHPAVPVPSESGICDAEKKHDGQMLDLTAALAAISRKAAEEQVRNLSVADWTRCVAATNFGAADRSAVSKGLSSARMAGRGPSRLSTSIQRGLTSNSSIAITDIYSEDSDEATLSGSLDEDLESLKLEKAPIVVAPQLTSIVYESWTIIFYEETYKPFTSTKMRDSHIVSTTQLESRGAVEGTGR
ncbi:hypothetical protein QBC46DRAFT_416968 [Diplogelasinospora grovesii]|uniref:Uncharacterized protein n=1 Tax=Diplogelasinospora grovesii TaxID=303347 RepID=A0AAN6NHY2_9PEZI|nr:hypothetical protein QBC46DRAFT_416968 [Diplogelasinospora grovesii]